MFRLAEVAQREYLMAVLDACSGSDLAHARETCYSYYLVTWAFHISKP